MYLSSADMMQRNLDRRVEITFPVEDKKIKDDLLKTLIKISLKDNIKGRTLNSDMTYSKLEDADSQKKIDSQEWLMNQTVKKSGNYSKTKVSR